MKIYSVNGDTKHLLLVDGLDVLNGSYTLIRYKGEGPLKGKLVTPHTYLPVKFECSVKRRSIKGLYDYDAMFKEAEEIIAQREKDELEKSA